MQTRVDRMSFCVCVTEREIDGVERGRERYGVEESKGKVMNEARAKDREDGFWWVLMGSGGC